MEEVKMDEDLGQGDSNRANESDQEHISSESEASIGWRESLGYE